VTKIIKGNTRVYLKLPDRTCGRSVIPLRKRPRHHSPPAGVAIAIIATLTYCSHRGSKCLPLKKAPPRGTPTNRPRFESESARRCLVITHSPLGLLSWELAARPGEVIRFADNDTGQHENLRSGASLRIGRGRACAHLAGRDDGVLPVAPVLERADPFAVFAGEPFDEGADLALRASCGDDRKASRLGRLAQAPWASTRPTARTAQNAGRSHEIYPMRRSTIYLVKPRNSHFFFFFPAAPACLMPLACRSPLGPDLFGFVRLS
jgi:hypothetical protein